MSNKDETTLEDLSDMIALFSEGKRVLGSKNKFVDAVSRLIISSQVTIKNYESLIAYILDCVIDEWREEKIKKEDLLKSNKRGEVMVAKKMAIILIKKQIDINNEVLSKYFGNATRQSVYLIMQEYSVLDKKIKEHAIFIERYNRLQTKILQFIETLK